MVRAADLAEIQDYAVSVVEAHHELILAGCPFGPDAEGVVATLAAVGGAVLVLELQLSSTSLDARLELDYVGLAIDERFVERVGALGIPSVAIAVVFKAQAVGAVDALALCY